MNSNESEDSRGKGLMFAIAIQMHQIIFVIQGFVKGIKMGSVSKTKLECVNASV